MLTVVGTFDNLLFTQHMTIFFPLGTINKMQLYIGNRIRFHIQVKWDE